MASAQIPNDLASFLRRMDAKMQQLEASLQGIRVNGNIPAALPGQYPGKPVPSIEGIEITVPANTNPQSGNIVLVADGPFYARAIHFAWRSTDAGANLGFWRPVAHNNCLEIVGGVATDVIDFYWEYQSTGSHRNRQNIPVPSAILQSANDGRGYFEFLTEDVMEASTTITVKIQPTNAPTHNGVLYVGFSGVYVLP